MVATSSVLHHGSSRLITIDEMERIPGPLGTDTWKPVQHRKVVDSVHTAIQARGFSVASEEYSITPDDAKMFGVIKLQDSRNPEWRRCIGLRNGNDRRMPLGVAVGVNVYVCDNMCLSSEIVVHRKHTARFELEPVIEMAMDGLEGRFESFESRLVALKEELVSHDDAAILAVKIAEAGGIRSSDIVPIIEEFQNPRHEEFRGGCRWNLLNAVTEISKKFQPVRYRVFQRVLSEAFQLG